MSFSKLRIAAGLTLEDVSRKFGISPAAVRDWEQGMAQPPSHVARSLEAIRDSVAARPPAEAAETGQPASSAGLIRSKKRVADHGEVFTPTWLVERMLDLVEGETERIDSRFLEPACGSGNFLLPILQRKLAAVELKYGRSDFEKRHHALQALTCLYGIELLADNVAECRSNLLAVFADYLKLDETEDLYRAAAEILSLNLIHGDAMTMRGADGEPVRVVEWGYLGKGKFQRRDFRLDVLTGMASLRDESSLFAGLGNHEIFKPAESYPPMTVRDLAAANEAPIA